MRYVMLLSFMLELLSRHRHSLLMKGDCVCVSVCVCVCVCVCVLASANNSLYLLCVHSYACVCSECTTCVHVSGHACMCVCVSVWEDCGDSCSLDMRSLTTWQPTTMKGQGLCSLETYNILSQFARITHLCHMTYVTCSVH